MYRVYRIEWDEQGLVEKKKFGQRVAATTNTMQTGALKRASLFWFAPVCEFDPKHLQLFQDYGSQPDEILDQMDKLVNKIIGTDGTVTLSCTKHEVEGTNIGVYGCILEHKEQGWPLEIKTFKQVVNFQTDAKSDINNIIGKKEKQLRK